jgi:phosphatidylglycerol---prolipoprotein diacylglyceryl transferase
MSHKSLTRPHTAAEAVPHDERLQPKAKTHPSDEYTTLMEKATQEILAVTYWFDPTPNGHPSPVTVRFSGHRVDVKEQLSAGNRFTQDERIEAVVPGSGPIAVTARVCDINAGAWIVTASVLRSTHSPRVQQQRERAALVIGPRGPIVRFWRTWAPSVESREAVHTCLTPLAHVPGIVPGIWGAMVLLGMVLALAIQHFMISTAHLVVGPWWTVTLVALVIGAFVAKTWYIISYRREHLINGWCIQGFITGAILAAVLLLAVFQIPVGVFLDMTAPGLLLAMAVGRVGCFFAGCCGGPPTASRWGVWSSDQRIGVRRVPTQLMELGLALSLGLAVLVAILHRGPASGAFFVAGLSAYTLLRQGVLHLRAEPHRATWWSVVTVALMALALVAAVVVLTR